VRVLQRLSDRQVGQLERGLHSPGFAAGELGLQQAVEEGVRRDLLAHRLAEHLLELLGRVGAAERQQPLARRVDVELGASGGHRATSASAA
jgi:hypothetical protein